MSRSVLAKPVVLAMCLLVTLCTPASGQEVGSKEWLEAALQKASNASIPGNTFFEIQTKQFANGDNAQLKALEAEIDGKPEHPKQMEYKELRRRLTNGPDVTRTRMWYIDDNHWRVSIDTPTHPSSRIPWQDSAVNGNSAWRLIPDTVTVLDVASPKIGFNPNIRKKVATNNWRGLVTGGLFRSTRWEVLRTDRSNSDWSAVITDPDHTREVTLKGSFDHDGSLFIHESVLTKLDSDPMWVGTWSRYTPAPDGFLPSIVPGLRPARSVEYGSPRRARAPQTDALVVSRHLSDDDDPTLLLAVPQPGQTDPVRDLSALTGIIDRATNQVFDASLNGLQRVGTITNKGDVQKTGPSWFQPVAVVLFIAAIGTLLFIRMRQKM